MNRRTFLQYALAGVAAAAAWPEALAAVEERNGMPYRPLGNTGERVSLLGLGGNHLDRDTQTDEECIRMVRTAVDEGINFLDNARSYNDGKAERRYGLALKDGYRDKVFLMTKSRKRNGAEARTELEESLRHFQTDHVDLWQVHAIESEEDIERAYADDGVLLAAIKAREEGLIRYIGFSGHDYPAVHRSMIEHGHPWATVQMPLNPCDYHYLSFQKEVIPVARERGIGILAMKTTGRGNIPSSGIATAEECLRYAMSLPVSTVISGMDNLEMLKQNIAIAKSFKPFEPAEVEALLERVRPVAEDGKLETFKAGV